MAGMVEMLHCIDYRYFDDLGVKLLTRLLLQKEVVTDSFVEINDSVGVEAEREQSP